MKFIGITFFLTAVIFSRAVFCQSPNQYNFLKTKFDNSVQEQKQVLVSSLSSLRYQSKSLSTPYINKNFSLFNVSDSKEIVLIDGTTWREESDVINSRLYPVLGTIAGLNLAGYLYVSSLWYENETSNFHTLDFHNDMRKNRYLDKVGHFTDAYFVSDLTAKAYRWSGLSGESSVWYGALTGFIWMLEIEISDGFFEKWGFSWGDLISNAFGSGFFVLQNYFPEVLGGIQPKFSYHVSQAWKDGNVYYTNPDSFIDDYEGLTFWLGVNIHHYLPEKWKQNYPEWLAPLGIAVGYGAEGISRNIYKGESEWYLSLDVDLRKIPVGDDSGLIKFLKSEFNFIKVPMPTVRITPGGDVWYGFYF